MKFKKGDRIIGIGCYDGKNIEGLKGTIISDKPLNSQFAIEFDKHIGGHECGGSGKSGHCWWLTVDHFRLDCNKTIVIYCKDNEVIAFDKSTGNKGIARCCPGDTFDFETGAKLAFERLTSSQVKEVKRYAKPGEYIKIVKPSGCDIDEYKKGDILKVVEYDNAYTSPGTAYYKNEIWKYVDSEEYVVLEGYEPPKQEIPTYYNGKIIFTKGDDIFKTGHIYKVKDGKIKIPSGRLISTVVKPFKDLDDVKDFFSGKLSNSWSCDKLEFIEVAE